MTTTRVLLRLDHTLTTLNALEEAVAAAEGLIEGDAEGVHVRLLPLSLALSVSLSLSLSFPSFSLVYSPFLSLSLSLVG